MDEKSGGPAGLNLAKHGSRQNLRVLIVIPVNSYWIILGKCEMKSREFSLLKNGIVEHPERGDEVHFLCTEKQAEAIVEFVSRVAPEHRPNIHQVHSPDA
jgi:hypothetical protein